MNINSLSRLIRKQWPALRKLGIAPGTTFKMSAFSPDVQKAISEGVAEAQKRIPTIKRGKNVNGWEITLDMGRYGKNYPYRAAWTFYGVGGQSCRGRCLSACGEGR